MRSIAKHALVASLLAAPLALSAAPASAQNPPSADQIIQSLKPSGDLLTGHTRGIRRSLRQEGAAARQGHGAQQHAQRNGAAPRSPGPPRRRG